jgi:hypothetical membrane protein
MKWFGIALTVVSAIVCLVAIFHSHNTPWAIGSGVFFIIGLFVIRFG